MLKLPAIKTEYARKSLYFTGAISYNTLRLELREIENINKFKDSLNTIFQQHVFISFLSCS